MQDPLNDDSNAVFVFDDQSIGAAPKSSTMRPIRRAGNNVPEIRIMELIADTLRRRMIQRVRTFTGWTDHQIRTRIRGSLQMNNIDGGRHAHNENLTLSELTTERIFEILERATGQGSNPDLTIYHVEWMYWINPLTLHVGGSESQDKHRGCDTFEWKGDDYPGCAALSIGN